MIESLNELSRKRLTKVRFVIDFVALQVGVIYLSIKVPFVLRKGQDKIDDPSITSRATIVELVGDYLIAAEAPSDEVLHVLFESGARIEIPRSGDGQEAATLANSGSGSFIDCW